MAERVITKFGRVDVLVNNAGIMPLSFLAKRKVDEWDRMIDVNIKGVLYGIDAVRGFVGGFSEIAIEPAAIARAVVYAIEQPEDVSVNEIIVRPTKQKQ